MNRYTAAVVFTVLAMITALFIWTAEVKGADAVIDTLDRLSLVLMLLAGIAVAALIFFIALYFFVKFQQHDDRGEIERMKALREYTALDRELAKLQQQQLKALPAPAQAQLPIWNDADASAKGNIIYIED